MEAKARNLLSSEVRDTLAAYIHQKNPLPDGLKDWFAQLTLLYGVPFNNLVLDEKMLPMESLRFFYLDNNWLKALIDGAFSIAIHSSRDIKLQEAMMKIIIEDIYKNILDLRKKLRGEATVNLEGKSVAMGDISGMLLRSSLVSGWQGLEIKGFDAEEETIALLRMERLAPDVMLVIFDSVPTKVEILEPGESLSFGFVLNGFTEQIMLRKIEGNNTVGQQIKDGNQQPKKLIIKDNHYRNKAKRVLNIAAIKTSLNTEFPNLSPAGFAVQMVKSPIKQVYENESSRGIAPTIRGIGDEKEPIDKKTMYQAFFKNNNATK